MTALCGVCQQAQFKYTCPKCEVVYCSLQCYQKHSSKCTEGFFQQQVQGELQSTKASGEEKKMLEKVLSKLNSLDEDSEDGDEGEGNEGSASAEELEERRLEELASKAETDELAVEDLTEEEARRFHSELKRGSIGQLLHAWEPWWTKAGVVEVEDETPAEEATKAGGALPSQPPMHICCAEGREPHMAVAFTSLSALYAYVHTMRAFNGEWIWSPLRAAPQLLHLCPAICSREVHNSQKECLRASLSAAAWLPGRFGTEFDILCLSDLSAVIRGGADFCVRALRETMEILEGCVAGGGQGKSGKLRRGVKKLEFLASFVFHHFELLEPLAAFVDALYRTVRSTV